MTEHEQDATLQDVLAGYGRPDLPPDGPQETPGEVSDEDLESCASEEPEGPVEAATWLQEPFFNIEKQDKRIAELESELESRKEFAIKLRNSRMEILKLAAIAQDAKEAAAAAKKALEEAKERHFEMEERLDRELQYGQASLPFGPDESEPCRATTGDLSLEAPTMVATDRPSVFTNLEPAKFSRPTHVVKWDYPPTSLEDKWRTQSVANLMLSPGAEKSLTDAGIYTLADITDWTEAGKALTQIPEIGKVKADKIVEAVNRILKRVHEDAAEPESVSATPEPAPEFVSSEDTDGATAVEMVGPLAPETPDEDFPSIALVPDPQLGPEFEEEEDFLPAF